MPHILICFGLVSAISRSITVFIGRIVGGFISDRFTLKSILIFGIFAEALIYTLLFFNVFTGPMLVFLTIVLGVFDSILIPFIYSYAKETIETNALSALFGYGNVFGLICAVTASGIATIIIHNISIRYIEIMYVILLGMLFLFLMRIKRKMQKVTINQKLPFAVERDPLYSKENVKRLEKAIGDAKSGNNMHYHELMDN